MASQLLPGDGKVTFTELAAAIASAPRALGVSDSVSLRTVAFVSETNLFLFAGGVFVGEDLGPPELIRASNGLLLIANRTAATSVADSDALRDFLQSWRVMVDARSPLFGFNQALNVRRHVRGDVSSRQLPYWQADLYEATTMGTAAAPHGPVVSSRHSLLFDSASAAAAEFLKNPFIQGWGGTRSSLDMVIWDPRAYIERVDVKAQRLEVHVHSRVPLGFHCGVVFKDEGNARARDRQAVIDGRASFDVPEGVDWFEIILAGEDDFAYDEKRGGLKRRGKPSARQVLRQRLAPNNPRIGGLALLGQAEAESSGGSRRLKKSGRDSSTIVDTRRLKELRALEVREFDLRRLIRLCEELNSCYRSKNFLAVAALNRAVIDHIPPVLGHRTFAEVADQYKGGRSLKASLQKLQTSARSIADKHLHQPIRASEALPERTQVDFRHDLDVLLEEIVRVLRAKQKEG